MAGDGARAVQAARQGQIATLVLPADCAWNDAAASARLYRPVAPRSRIAATIEQVAAALKNGKRSLLLMRGRCLEAAGREAAGRIAAATGARIAHDYFTPRITRGGRPAAPSSAFPISPNRSWNAWQGLEQIVLVGAPPPVTFFAYPDKPSWVTPQGCELADLGGAARRTAPPR